MRPRGVLLLAGLIVASLLAVGAWLYTPDKARAALEAQYAAPPSVFLPIARLRLHVRDTGPRDAAAVVLLHGFGSSLQTWDAWAEPLSRSYRVVRLDLPGFGLTGADPSGDYSDDRAVEVLLGLLDALSLERVILVGNSLGGKIAWMFAARHPDRVARLVLVSPDGFASPGFEYGRKPAVPLLARLLPYTLPRFLVRMTVAPAFANPAAMTDARVERYRDLMLAPDVRPAMLARMAQVELQPPQDRLRQITAPTLLLWGDLDAMIPLRNADDYLAVMQDCRLVHLPGVGHVPQEEAPARSLAAVEAFLGQTP